MNLKSFKSRFMKTTAFDRYGRMASVFIPCRDCAPENVESEVAWYVDKFLMRVNGSTLDVARAWVEGINYNSEMTEAIWSAILAHPLTEIDDSINPSKK